MRSSIRVPAKTAVLLLLVLFMAGCGKTAGSLRGTIVEDGKPKEFGSNEAALQLTMVKPDGKLDNSHSYTAVVNADGTFEVVASGGELTPGNYQVAIQFRGGNDKYKAFAAPDSKVRREIKPGANNFQIDLAKPDA